jgi:DUF4097 and DUF4098 domain-containing protein YvlB
MVGCGPTVWVEDLQQMTVPAGEVEQLYVKTHNGSVTVTGTDSREDIAVQVKRRGGGATEQSAMECLDAIEIVSASTEDKTHELTWRWRVLKRSDWGSQVSFTVEMPARLATQITTHNGGVSVTGVHADCAVTTHNGGLSVKDVHGACDLHTHNGGIGIMEGEVAPLTAVTHNGAITATTSGSAVRLKTHNGGIKLDASRCGPLGGSVTTHNGNVALQVGEATTAELVCKTHNGRLTCDAPARIVSLSKRSLRAALGDGGPELALTTHNGGIHVQEVAAE